jgi:aminoglycoside phosphotransferase (APT) family kinase protein
MSLIEALQPAVERYLSQHPELGGGCAEPRVTPLAQGEYNINYLLDDGAARRVLRVNIASQLPEALRGPITQIAYEHGALALLAASGVTPRPLHLDERPGVFAQGLLIEEYLPGEPLDYARDLEAAGRLFARVHGQPVPADHHLIVEQRPLGQMLEECETLLATYLESAWAAPDVASFLRELRQAAREAAPRGDAFFAADPWRCVINTEVNSGNFIANRAAGTLHLVDWEKALYGDPSQDLSHFGVPTTTLWKTEHRLDDHARRALLDAYRAQLGDAHQRDTIAERVRLRDPFNCLRGIAWSAMAWVGYREGSHALQNADTRRKLDRYLELPFLRALFAPYAALGLAR